MRKIILTVVALTGLVVFSGCAGATLGEKVVPKKVSKVGVEYSINKDGSDFLVVTDIKTGREYRKIIRGSRKPASERIATKRKVINAQISMAAEATRGMGYNYFAVTNIDVSNLQGSPITNKKDLVRYATLFDRKPNFSTGNPQLSSDYRQLVTKSEIFIRFIPISDKVANSGSVYVWSVRDNL